MTKSMPSTCRRWNRPMSSAWSEANKSQDETTLKKAFCNLRHSFHELAKSKKMPRPCKTAHAQTSKTMQNPSKTKPLSSIPGRSALPSSFGLSAPGARCARRAVGWTCPSPGPPWRWQSPGWPPVAMSRPKWCPCNSKRVRHDPSCRRSSSGEQKPGTSTQQWRAMHRSCWWWWKWCCLQYPLGWPIHNYQPPAATGPPWKWNWRSTQGLQPLRSVKIPRNVAV